MKALELLAPARNADIGIAAIDCGADAVYIAGPAFGARKDAGNSLEDVARVCEYAHAFGARVFLTVNTMLRDEEIAQAHSLMLEAQDRAGVDAFIIQDLRLLSFDDIRLPVHASTQCTVLSVERAVFLEEQAGVGRIVLERELSLDEIRRICSSVSCEVEAFVHGALCVCYSGQCYMSEVISGRSANRGECIQACRSLYDLEDGDGKVLVRDKALLSLKDLNLIGRLGDLADAGVSSFKIEGRLKNVSYVRNVVRAYSAALDEIIAKRLEEYRRASFGHVRGGVEPALQKTFNRGYTSLFLDGNRGRWSSMDAPKGMGESIGTIGRVRREGKQMVLTVKPRGGILTLSNGDGFSVITRCGIIGFRGDVCEGLSIRSKIVEGIREGDRIFRNFDSAFEKKLESQICRRELDVSIVVRIHKGLDMEFIATSEDGRTVTCPFGGDMEAADNVVRQLSLFREQLSKRSGAFCFTVSDIIQEGSRVPLLSASILNSIRRLVASDLEAIPIQPTALCQGKRMEEAGTRNVCDPVSHTVSDELMRTKYCIRYELGMCPKFQDARPTGPLFLVNQGRRWPLRFDCARCEMSVLRETSL